MSYTKQYCFLLFALITIAVFSCDTEGPGNFKSHFVKYYGEDGDQEAKNFIANEDGSVVMVGTTTGLNGNRRVYVVKADEQGKQLWSLKFGGETNESGQDIKRITFGPDAGNYLVMSNAEKIIADSIVVRLTIVSESGDSLKSFLIDRFESQEAKSLTALPSGQFYITGQVLNSDTLNAELPAGVFDLEDSFNMTIGNDYTIVDSDRYGRSTVASGVKIIDKSNSINYALYTDEWTGAENTFETNFVFRKLTKSAEPDLISFYSGTDDLNEFLADIDQSISGEFLAVGTQINPASNFTQIYASRVNSSYNQVLNDGTIEGAPSSAEGVAVHHSTDAGFFWVLGNEMTGGGGGGGRNIWVGKVDGVTLETSFSRKFGGSNNDDTGSAILQLDNGDLLILGTMELVNQKKIALIRIKPNGQF